MALSPEANPTSDTGITEELKHLVQRAEHGDRAAVPALRGFLDRQPELWRAYGDLAATAERAWVGLISGDNALLAESLARTLGSMKEDLAGLEGCPPLEQLLVARIVACWLQVHYADACCARLARAAPEVARIKAAAEVQDRAHRRYLAAIKQLALVRKLLRPVRSPARIAAKPGGERTGTRLAASLPSTGHEPEDVAGLSQRPATDPTGEVCAERI